MLNTLNWKKNQQNVHLTNWKSGKKKTKASNYFNTESAFIKPLVLIYCPR